MGKRHRADAGTGKQGQKEIVPARAKAGSNHEGDAVRLSDAAAPRQMAHRVKLVALRIADAGGLARLAGGENQSEIGGGGPAGQAADGRGIAQSHQCDARDGSSRQRGLPIARRFGDEDLNPGDLGNAMAAFGGILRAQKDRRATSQQGAQDGDDSALILPAVDANRAGRGCFTQLSPESFRPPPQLEVAQWFTLAINRRPVRKFFGHGEEDLGDRSFEIPVAPLPGWPPRREKTTEAVDHGAVS